MTPKIEIVGQKFAHFGGFEGSFLTFLRVEKDFFWTFLKLFCSCVESVWEVFLTLKCLILVVFVAPKVDMTPKIEISGKNFVQFGGFGGSFLTILG